MSDLLELAEECMKYAIRFKYLLKINRLNELKIKYPYKKTNSNKSNKERLKYLQQNYNKK